MPSVLDPTPPVTTTGLEDSSLEPVHHEAYAAWKADANPTTNAGLLKSVTPILKSAVRSYAGPDASPVMMSRAKLATLAVMPKYDPSKGRLSTFLHRHLQGLRRVSAEANAPIRVPEEVRLGRHHMYEAERELQDELGRAPTDADLSDRMGIPISKLARLRGAAIVRRDQMTGQDGMPVDGPAVASVADQDDRRRWQRTVYDSYPDTHAGHLKRLVLENAFGMHGRPRRAMSEIATMAGLTKGRVSQLASEIQADLDDAERYDVTRG